LQEDKVEPVIINDASFMKFQQWTIDLENELPKSTQPIKENNGKFDLNDTE
jgi:hypothetical protein